MATFVRNLLLTLLLSAGLGEAAHADRPWRDRDRERGGERQRGMSLDQAVQMVQRQFNARVVRTETLRNGDRTVYRLRLLSEDGRVWSVSVDAATGSVQ